MRLRNDIVLCRVWLCDLPFCAAFNCALSRSMWSERILLVCVCCLSSSSSFSSLFFHFLFLFPFFFFLLLWFELSKLAFLSLNYFPIFSHFFFQFSFPFSFLFAFPLFFFSVVVVFFFVVSPHFFLLRFWLGLGAFMFRGTHTVALTHPTQLIRFRTYSTHLVQFRRNTHSYSCFFVLRLKEHCLYMFFLCVCVRCDVCCMLYIVL